MWRPLLLMSAFGLLLSSLMFATCTSQPGTPARRQMQMMEMMKDSVMAQAMMNHIAFNGQMRMAMMRAMMEQANGDSLSMKQMCQMLMDDKEMHRMMMTMMRQEAARHDSIGIMPADKLKHETAHEHRHP